MIKSVESDTCDLVRSGHEFFQTALHIIQEAQDRIYLLVYIFQDDETGKKISAALLQAAARKVRVCLLVDAYASSGLSIKTIRSFKEAGIQFRFFNPIFRSGSWYFGRRLHAKVLLADAHVMLIGGLNIADRYNDTMNGHAWLDFAVKVQGSSVKAMEEECCRYVKDRPSDRKHAENDSIIQHKIHLRINDWIYHRNDITQTYAYMFTHAQHYIIILCSYFIPGSFLRRLIKKATQRGVQVELIVAGDSDIPIAKYAERWLYDWLLRHQIKLYEYNPTILHGKMALMDDKLVTIGSYNVNNISAYASVEMNVDITEDQFINEIKKELIRIKKNECTEVDIGYHQHHKTWLNQLLRWISYMIYRIIFILTTFYYRQKN